MELARGARIDRYEVEEVLGAGGMAVVYRVRHLTLGTRHALKLLTSPGRKLRERLIREGRAQATLTHPHIVTVHDVVEVEGAPGLVMEFVDGPTLRRLLQIHRPSWDQVDVIARGVLAAVAHAHQADIVHRDLKPANVMLSLRDGTVVAKVTDFGIAKLLAPDSPSGATATGVAMGTPAYMAPEQFTDARSVDARADVFSLGAMLYELTTGQMAFPASDLMAIYLAVSSGSFVDPAEVRPDLPERMATAIRGALVPSRDRRLASVAELLAAWEGEGTDAPAPPLDASRVWSRPELDHLRAMSLETPAAPLVRAAETSAALLDASPAETSYPPADDLPRREPALATSADTRLEEAFPAPRWGLWAVGALGVVAVAAGTAWLTWPPAPEGVGSGHPGGAITQVQAAPDDVAAPPTAVAPPPAPEPVVPTTVAPPATPSRSGATLRSGGPGAPSPTPVDPAAAVPTTGTVRVVGEGKVELERDGQRLPPGAVPAGSWRVFASFEGAAPRETGTIVVEAGQTLTLTCVASFRKCSVL